MHPDCPFCSLPTDRVVAKDQYALTVRDGFPVSPGHTLVISQRHVASLFDLTDDEQAAIWKAVRAAKEALDSAFQPAGYNVGVNVGAAAGQTVMHAHVHIIPRYKGDTPDPRGGVRWVLSDKAVYWSEP